MEVKPQVEKCYKTSRRTQEAANQSHHAVLMYSDSIAILFQNEEETSQTWFFSRVMVTRWQILAKLRLRQDELSTLHYNQL